MLSTATIDLISRRNDIRADLAALKTELDEVREKLDSFELSPDDFIDDYEVMLDELYGSFMGYAASTILYEVDPTAYRCGLNDYVDGLDLDNSDAYCALQDREGEIESAIEFLEEEEEEITNQLEMM